MVGGKEAFMIDRLYERLIKEHFKFNRQMLFLIGPRQVGKTTASLEASLMKPDHHYLNWDSTKHRKVILEGQQAVADFASLSMLKKNKPFIIFDELHKYDNWKNFLKGFFDIYGHKCKIIVTGSARLDIFRSCGDSLMGRYFSYRLHPLSIAEWIDPKIRKQEINFRPKKISEKVWKDLFEFGGFPEPFMKKNMFFYRKWKKYKQKLLFQEDINDFSKIQEIKLLEVLTEILLLQAGSLLNYSNLSKKIGVSINTIRKWISILNGLFFSYTILPWEKNISRSLLKQPKLYLWDWALIEDIGAKIENFVASHLLKATQFWTDYGFGEFQLFFLRDKEKREVDFLISKNNKPWILVEVKKSSKNISKSLHYFKSITKAEFAFQVNYDDEFISKDCFSINEPVIVPLKTFLSQLI